MHWPIHTNASDGATIRDSRVMIRSSRPRDFESSVRPHLSVLYRVGLRLTRNAEEAEDLVSQTMVNAFNAWSRFDGDYVRSWLIKILRNEFLNVQRRKGSRPVEVELDDAEGVSDTSWTEVVGRLEAGRILEEVDRLPEEYRLAVTLCDVEQMSYEEAAEAMDVPVGTVRSRLFRGRARLRQRLGHVVAEEVR